MKVIFSWLVVGACGGGATATSDAPASSADGSLWCWGGNYFGRLGTGDMLNRPSPTKIGTASDWLHVATPTVGSLTLLARQKFNRFGSCQARAAFAAPKVASTGLFSSPPASSWIRYSGIGSGSCAVTQSSRYFLRTYGSRDSTSSRSSFACLISSNTSVRSFMRCGELIPDASLSSTNNASGISERSPSRIATSAGSGNLTGFGNPSPG